MTKDQLIAHAIEARTRAFAPYSGFKVGAAVFSHEGKVFKGGNVETDMSACGICAERIAISNTVLAGHRPLSLAMVTDTEKPMTPCGICRQFMVDFSPIIIITATLAGLMEVYSSDHLLPNHFQRRNHAS
jgi:cytidine deaminase